ncbi:MAG TPA: hypothetical protein VNO32_09395, partial [Candidatus Acidoferrum sp.]|nr:hypothetical protein [Candidatus Acidoferrum sp.]
ACGLLLKSRPCETWRNEFDREFRDLALAHWVEVRRALACVVPSSCGLDASTFRKKWNQDDHRVRAGWKFE